MLPENIKKSAFVLDYSVINNPSACFNILDDYLQLGDIFINYDWVSISSNNKLKKHIIVNGVRTCSDMIEIYGVNNNEHEHNNKTPVFTSDSDDENDSKYEQLNGQLNDFDNLCKDNLIKNSQTQNKIIIRKAKISWPTNETSKMFDEYYALQNNYNPIIFTLSMDVVLECKLKNVECSLYVNNSDGSIGMYETKKTDNSDKNKIPRIERVAPRLNQFKYDDENKTLERFIGNDNWKSIDNTEIYGFNPLSYKQKAYLDLLLDENISLVLCSGSAGTGKTFLACLAGVFKMLDQNKYDNIVLSRATIDIGDNSIGFLPGSKEEKMSHWIQPMKDNLDIILKKVKEKRKESKTDEDSSNESSDIETFEYSAMLTLSKKQRKKQQKKVRKMTRFSYIDTQKQKEEEIYTTDSLIKDEKVKIECISFFRGRTFIDTFCVIDEAQNLTIHEIKTIITRIGKGSKLVMIGDIEQSDLKKKNTDFCDVINKMAGHEMVGVIQLDKSVRSDLATLAVSVL